ncbi:hypothetical protein ANO11243_051780 [Dothideomycetidae sp. 11243]|nr:hypothetical protein ANO11243_051780 [fungal sp. No.11243]
MDDVVPKPCGPSDERIPRLAGGRAVGDCPFLDDLKKKDIAAGARF